VNKWEGSDKKSRQKFWRPAREVPVLGGRFGMVDDTALSLFGNAVCMFSGK